MKNKTLFRLAMAGCLAALTLCATLLIQIPLPNGGYLNAGDAVVLITGCLLSPKFAFFSAAIGSALADLISGYVIYIPVTFFVKGIMALIVGIALAQYKKKNKPNRLPILAFIAAELLMITTYYVFEGFLYGFVASLSGVPFNAVQGVFGILVSSLVVGMILRRSKK